MLAKIGKKICLRIFLKEKNAFLDYKNNQLKKSENLDFPKGLVPGFGQIFEIFSCFYFRQNSQGIFVSQDFRKKIHFSRV